MRDFKLNTDPRVNNVFDNYPASVRSKLLNLRALILQTANESEEITALEETLKWGEPSYLTKKGSTIRIDWKKKKADQYAIYFKCTTMLVPTFKMVYYDLFKYEGNRAIIFDMNDKIPEAELKECISLGLRYHSVKHLALLGLERI